MLLLAVTACSGQDEPTPTTAEAEEPAAGADEAASETGDAAPGETADDEAPDEEPRAGSDDGRETTSDEQAADQSEDAGAEAERSTADPGTSEGGPAPYPKGEDPCGHLIAEDLSEAIGREVVDTPADEASELAKQYEDADGDLIQCYFPTDNPRELMLAANWLRFEVDMPDEMPEDIAAEHQRALHVNYAKGQDGVQEVEVAGVPEAYSKVLNSMGKTSVNVYVPFDDAVLVASLIGPEGSLDESDIPRAASAAEVAIDAP